MPAAKWSAGVAQEDQYDVRPAGVVGERHLAATRGEQCKGRRERPGRHARWLNGNRSLLGRHVADDNMMLIESILAPHFDAVNLLLMGVTVQAVGTRIRAARLRKGLTIPVLSQLSGLSPGFLSQIETGKASLSLDSLTRIADSLGLCTGDLLAAPPPAPRVVRAEQRPRVRWGTAPETEYLAPPVEASLLQGALLRLPPGGMAGGDHLHAGQELLWVLDGTVRVVQGEHEVELGAGDSVLVEGRVPHTYEAVGPGEARILVVTSPPAELPVTA